MKRGNEKYSVNITISRLKMAFFTNSHAKRRISPSRQGLQITVSCQFSADFTFSPTKKLLCTCHEKNYCSPRNTGLHRLRKSALGNGESILKKAHLIRGFQGKLETFHCRVMDILRNPSSNLTQFYRMSGLADVTDDGIQSLMDLGMIVNQFQKQPEPEQGE